MAGCSRSGAIEISSDSSSDSSNEVTLHSSTESPVKAIISRKYRSAVRNFVKEERDDLLDDRESQASSVVLTSDEDDGDRVIVQPVKRARRRLFDDRGEAVYERSVGTYTAERILGLLLNPDIDETRVAKTAPKFVSETSTYIVDLTQLDNPNDVKKDGLGKWNYSGSHEEYYRSYYDKGQKVHFERCAKGATGKNVFVLRRLRSSHPSDASVRRLVAFVSDVHDNPHHLALGAYVIPDGSVALPHPHGNSKTNTPFYPTLPSTVEKIKSEKSVGPKETVARVSVRVGGVMEASGPGMIPRGEQQVSNLKWRIKRDSRVTQSGVHRENAADELYVVMQRAHLEDPQHKFIRHVKMSPEPAIILYTDTQIQDLVRFCTCTTQHCVLTIDPTFSLGDFDVTVMTYRNLLVKSERTGQPPIFIGPIMIHYQKSFGTYLFFASSIVGECSDLQSLQAFGTDGEKALYDAMQHTFPNAAHLLCSRHCRGNITENLSKLHLPQGLLQQVIDDLFGRRSSGVYVEGLVDAKDEATFLSTLAVLESKWKGLDNSLSHFTQWFRTYKQQLFVQSMLRPVCEKAGLGSPPEEFTTNPSESANAVLKTKVDYKRSELPEFVQKVLEVVKEQQHEIERTILGRGKYRFTEVFSHLQIAERKWFSMSVAQKEKHVKRVSSTPIAGDRSSDQDAVAHSSSAAGTNGKKLPAEALVSPSHPWKQSGRRQRST